MGKWYRYVPHDRMDDYFRLGWMLAPCRPYPHMDEYRIIMMWMCDCGLKEPK